MSLENTLQQTFSQLLYCMTPYQLMLQLLAKRNDPFSGGRTYYAHPSLKEEGKPKIPHPDDTDWDGLDLPWMSFGYGVQLTPIQTLAYYNAIANNGELVMPRFVSSIRKFDGTLFKKFDRKIINPAICSEDTVKKLKIMMQGVVSKPWGTAHNIFDKNIILAGKTGTTQINYATDRVEYVSSFVGYFPANNPKYSCIVVISKPNKNT